MKMNEHLRLKHLLLSSLVITAFVTASIGTNSVAAAATGSKTFSLKATNGKSASSGAGIIATFKKDRLRKTPKKGKKFRARTFVLGVSDGTMADTEGINASPVPSNNSYVTVHYHGQTGKILAPDKILQGKIGDTYFTSIQNIAGYSLSEVPANTTGTFSSSQQSVTYVYGLTDVKADSSASTANKGVSSKIATLAPHKSQTKNATSNVVSQADVTSRILPQTGGNQGVQLSFQGLGFLSIFGGLIGTWCSRKGIKYS